MNLLHPRSIVGKVFLGNTFFVFTVLAIVSIMLSSCGSDPEPPQPTEEERVTQLLSSAKWKPATATGWVTVEGVDASELFVDFTITFTATGYTTTGTTPVWPRTDTWKFLSGSTTVLVRDSDGLQVTITSVDETTLKLSLFWNQETYEGGRSRSIMGKHEFSFSK